MTELRLRRGGGVRRRKRRERRCQWRTYQRSIFSVCFVGMCAASASASNRYALAYANVCERMLTYADVCWRMLAPQAPPLRAGTLSRMLSRMLTYAHVCWRMLAYAGVC